MAFFGFLKMVKKDKGIFGWIKGIDVIVGNY
jgi:hypothetical protein